jgi:hypothetical protein
MFDVDITPSSISRVLKKAGWSNKVTRRIAREQDEDLRDYYLYNSSPFRSYHRIYIDESGCSNPDGLRRNGWSPKGVVPVHTARFCRDKRTHILGAYSQDGLELFRLYKGTIDSTFY